jgi:hypothetical protein
MRLLSTRSIVVVSAFLTVLTVGAGLARAATLLVLSPSTTTPAVGSPFDVSLVIDGLDAGVAPSVGGFDVTILFDPSSLQLTDSSFGTGLGDPSLFEALADVDTAPGSVRLQEVSLLSAATLNASQGNPLVLANLEFVLLDPAATTLKFGSVLVSDELGQRINVDLLGATIGGTTNPIPEARTVVLYLIGALAFGWMVRSELAS